MATHLRHGKRVLVVFAMAAFCVMPGCVKRRYTLRTDPPGALAIVNGEEIGPTPVSHSFTYYGDRNITFMRDDHQTLSVIQPMDAPWWDNVFTEFISENLVPITLRDEREFSYRLVPSSNPPINDVLGRGDELRIQSQTAPPPRRGGFLGFFGF